MLVAILSRDFWMPDEPRYAQIAREMMWSGDYLVPRFNGDIYKEKPPLLFWAIAIASTPLGEVSEITARVPNFVSAIVTLLLTYALARRMFGHRTALLSTLVLAMSYRFWWQAQFGQIDMLLCACMTLSFYALWRWHEMRQTRWLIALYAGIALGLLAKGPPALLFPLLAAAVFYLRDLKSLRVMKLWIGVPASLAPVLLWLIPARLAASAEETAGGALWSTLYRQVYARLFLGTSHAQPIWYYLENMPIDWLPWTVFAPWIVVYAWRQRRSGPAMRFILSWIVPALIFFTLSTGKRALYILPTYPAIAILVACAMIALVETGRRRWIVPSTIAWCFLLSAVALLPLAAFVPSIAELWRPSLFVVSAVALACVVWSVFILTAKAWRHLPYALAFQFALLLGTGSAVVFPIADTLISARDLMAPIRMLNTKGDVIVFSAIRVRDEYLIYSQMLHRRLLARPGISAFDSDLSEDDRTKLQARLLDTLEKAAVSVPAFDPFTPKDIAAAELRDACRRAALEAGVPEDALAEWSASVEAEVAELLPAFNGPTPAILIVSTTHWPWIRAHLREPANFILLTRGSVREHDMMVLGNAAAASAWADVSANADPPSDGTRN